MKKLAILGSTGSIGSQSLEVVKENPDEFSVVALAAKKNIVKLEKQIRSFRPKMACVWDEGLAKELKKKVEGLGVEVVCGMEGLTSLATYEGVDVVIAAMVGMIGIRPVMDAIRAGKDVALANKETLVTAGHLIMPLVKEKGVGLLPVDSEHSAIFQSINGEGENAVSRILLTASGGPFRGRKWEDLQNVTLEDALNHPNWAMGQKITIDSATMVNKGLEVIEAKWLFGVSFDQIQVLVQPQSVIHSMVEFEDGAVMAQLGMPDMKLPIQYALTHPDRRRMSGERLDFTKIGSLEFEEPDVGTFRGLALAYEAGRTGGSMPTVYNAANEKAVALFLERKIAYLDIVRLIEEGMKNHITIANPSFEEVLAVEQETHARIEEEWMKRRV